MTEPSTPHPQEKRLLVVDDDEVLRERLARAFRERGLTVDTACDYASACAAAELKIPDLALVDLRMPGQSGLELVRTLALLSSAMKIVVLTGYGSIATAVQALQLGATNFLQKPATADDILQAFEPRPLDSPSEDPAAPSLARAEWEHINRVLADCSGNITRAAQRLGMHRRSLQRKLQKYPPKT